jgi:hypothetical protein
MSDARRLPPLQATRMPKRPGDSGCATWRTHLLVTVKRSRFIAEEQSARTLASQEPAVLNAVSSGVCSCGLFCGAFLLRRSTLLSEVNLRSSQ